MPPTRATTTAGRERVLAPALGDAPKKAKKAAKPPRLTKKFVTEAVYAARRGDVAWVTSNIVTFDAATSLLCNEGDTVLSASVCCYDRPDDCLQLLAHLVGVCGVDFATYYAIPGVMEKHARTLLGTVLVRYGSFADSPGGAAMAEGVMRVVNWLLERDPGLINRLDANGTGGASTMHDAACSTVPMLEEMVRRGGDVGLVGGRGNTLLHAAACMGTPATVAWLLEKGLGVNAVDVPFGTPLDAVNGMTGEAKRQLLVAAGGLTKQELEARVAEQEATSRA